ncbi:MAG: AAA family ATPase [Acidobacteriaceae bacterium]|nr:AAA family ATPase [Acidobacteriaceae bacterium]MBV9296874.1 AAA family ATPase [Acidobacteriaceae bacterium]
MNNRIALSGRSGSGKTVIAEYLVEKHGFKSCSSGVACRDLCRRLFGTESKTILNQVTDALKAIDSKVWLNAALCSVDDDRPLVFDSMRFSTDYDFFREREFTTWRIEAPLTIRLERMRKRGQSVTAEDDEHRAETELDAFVFDRVIDNSDEGFDLLHFKIEEALTVIR